MQQTATDRLATIAPWLCGQHSEPEAFAYTVPDGSRRTGLPIASGAIEKHLEARKQRLQELLKKPDGIRLSEDLDGDGATIFRHARKLGLKGIVSKRRDAPSRSGRSKTWLKVKNPESPAMRRLEEATD